MVHIAARQDITMLCLCFYPSEQDMAAARRCADRLCLCVCVCAFVCEYKYVVCVCVCVRKPFCIPSPHAQ